MASKRNATIPMPDALLPRDDDGKAMAAAKHKLAGGFRRNGTLLDAAAVVAFWTWLAGRDDDALAITRFIGETEFDGNFNVWSPVERALTLEARILRLRGDTQGASASLARVRPHVVATRLEGSLLKDANIARAVADGDKNGERIWRFVHLQELVFVNELRGNGTHDGAIAEQMDALRPLATKGARTKAKS